METLRIRKMAARYHLPPSAYAERERLNRILRDMMDGVLETALERAGISPGEVICLRSLHVPVRLRVSRGDAALAAAWSLALAEAIRHAVSASVTGIVHYTSRIQALADMAASVAAGSLERGWAWREIGIWRVGDSLSAAEAVHELVRALVAEPSAIVPVLRAVAGPTVATQAFSRLATMFAPEHWTHLAGAALNATQVSGELLLQAEPGVAEIPLSARRMLKDSALAQALGATPGAAWQAKLIADATVRRAIAVLIILESDPGILRADGRRARAITGAVADALYPAATGVAPPPEPEARLQPAPPQPEAKPSARSPLRDAPPSKSAPSARPQGPAPAVSPPPVPQPPEEESTILQLRRRALTSYGGLLFLLHIVVDLGLPDEIAALSAVSARSFRWSMHQLGMTLVPAAEADDPAVLAFAGLLPDSVPPSRGETPPGEAERAALDSLAARIVHDLKERMEEQTLASVSRRQGEIVADPGWIEVRLSLSDVSTDIRRAGLDLDLDYLPWLGAIVRFVYE